MCGIVGYIGKKDACEILVKGLRRLEYRGYDSSGIALHNGRKINSTKSTGKIANLEEKLTEKNSVGTLGIAHTRWATHGKPTEVNSHPHSAGDITLVHNGIIENYQKLKEDLIKKGHSFLSDTDSEVIAHLIQEENIKFNFDKSVQSALKKVKGAYALAIIHKEHPDKLIVVRNSSPLVIGVGNNEFVIASDASAIIAYTNKVVYLDDGELAIITPTDYVVKTISNKLQKKQEQQLEWNDEQAKKEGYEHFMLKEIHDQPHAIQDAIRGRIDMENGMAILGGLTSVDKRLRSINRIIIISCGTSYFSGLVGEYMIEEYAGIPTEVEYASEFRYRKPLLDENTVVIAISQSGETADTLAAIKEAKNKGALTLGVVNVVGSSIARETDAGIYNHAGPEVSVASTKAFTSQLTILTLIAVYLGRQRDMSMIMGRRILSELQKVPFLVSKILENKEKIKKIAYKYAKFENFFYLGRKYNYPIACEGALKIKEIAYIHAEGYPSGEMKHGPIALIDKHFPSVILAPKDSVYEKTLSAIEEIRAREGKVVIITTKDVTELHSDKYDIIYIPKTLEILMPIITTIPLQLLAYYVGIKRGHDVDQPKNLAKSVTVE